MGERYCVHLPHMINWCIFGGKTVVGLAAVLHVWNGFPAELIL